MAYDAGLRRSFKEDARAEISKKFWPTMGASLLAVVPNALVLMIYQRLIPSPNGADIVQAIFTMLFGIAGISLIYAIIQLFILVPIQYGAMYYYTYRARGQEASATLIFSCFGNVKLYANAVKLALCIFARSIAWGLLEIAAVAGLCVLCFYVYTDFVFTILILLAAIAVCVISLIVSVKIRRYDGAYIRLIDDPEMSAWEATGECAVTFREHNYELLVFDLSFILWQIGVGLTFGILSIYLDAYMNMSFVNYFDALREHETGISQRQQGGFSQPDDLPPL